MSQNRKIPKGTAAARAHALIKAMHLRYLALIDLYKQQGNMNTPEALLKLSKLKSEVNGFFQIDFKKNKEPSEKHSAEDAKRIKIMKAIFDKAYRHAFDEIKSSQPTGKTAKALELNTHKASAPPADTSQFTKLLTRAESEFLARFNASQQSAAPKKPAPKLKDDDKGKEENTAFDRALHDGSARLERIAEYIQNNNDWNLDSVLQDIKAIRRAVVDALTDDATRAKFLEFSNHCEQVVKFAAERAALLNPAETNAGANNADTANKSASGMVEVTKASPPATVTLLSELIDQCTLEVNNLHDNVDPNLDASGIQYELDKLRTIKLHVDDLARDAIEGKLASVKIDDLDDPKYKQALEKFVNAYAEAADAIASLNTQMSLAEFEIEAQELLSLLSKIAADIQNLLTNDSEKITVDKLASLEQRLENFYGRMLDVDARVNSSKKLPSKEAIKSAAGKIWALLNESYEKYDTLMAIADQQSQLKPHTPSKLKGEDSAMKPRSSTDKDTRTPTGIAEDADEAISSNPASEEEEAVPVTPKMNTTTHPLPSLRDHIDEPDDDSEEGLPDLSAEDSHADDVPPPPPPPADDDSDRDDSTDEDDSFEEGDPAPAPGHAAPPAPPPPPPVAAAELAVDTELEEAKLRMHIAEYRLAMLQRSISEGGTYLKELLTNELALRQATLKAAKDLVKELRRERKGERDVDIAAVNEQYTTAEQNDKNAEKERREFVRMRAEREPGAGEISEKQQREVFDKMRKDTGLKLYSAAIKNLVTEIKTAEKSIYNAELVAALYCQLEKYKRDLKDYKKLLKKVANPDNHNIYGSRFSKSTIYGDRATTIRYTKGIIKNLLTELSNAEPIINYKANNHIYRTTQRAHYQAYSMDHTDAAHQPVPFNKTDAATVNNINQKISAYLGTAETHPINQSVVVRGDLGATGVFTSRYVPTEMIIKQPGKLFYPDGKKIKIAVIEEVNEAKTLHTQTFKAVKLSEMDSAPESARLNFAMQAILRGKASVIKGPVIIPESMPPKMKEAFAKVCEHLREEYVVDAAIRRKAEKGVKAVADYFSQNQPYPLGARELAGKLDPATDNISATTDKTALRPR